MHAGTKPGPVGWWQAMGLRSLAAGILLLMAIAMAAPARAAAPIPAEAFFKQPAVHEARLSPNGRRLAIGIEMHGRVGIVVVDLEAADMAPKRTALFRDADVRNFDWVSDERLVLDVIDLRAGSGEDQHIAPGLFAVQYDGTGLTQLVDREGRNPITNGERVTTLTWNHELLRVPIPSDEPDAARPGEVLVAELQFTGNDLVARLPKWLDTHTGRTRSMDLAGRPRPALRWWVSPQGRPRAVLTRAEGRDTLHWFHAPQGDRPGRWVRLAEAAIGDLPWQPLWVGHGDLLYVTQPAGPRGERRVAPFDFAQGRPGPALVVADGFDFSGHLIGDDAATRLLGVRIDTDAEETHWFDPALKALQAIADQALPGRINRIHCRRCDGPDAVMVVRSWSDRQPMQLRVWRKAARGGEGAWSLVSSQAPQIDPARMGRLSFHRIRARDGLELPVWVTQPADIQPGQPQPAVVLVHGGPWVRHGRWHWDPMAQFLASRGYVVIEPEFRGSDGYGLAHMQAGRKQWGQAMQNDVADALIWARAQKIAGDKACIAGGNYGGYSTLMGLIRHPELYRCGSAWFAVADLMLYVDGGFFVRDDISAVGRRYGIPEWVGDPGQDRALLLANSPVELADRIRAPLQLIAGGDDLRTPVAHHKRLRSAMQKAGLEPEWIVYDGEAHGLRLADNRVDMALKLEAFLARHLK